MNMFVFRIQMIYEKQMKLNRDNFLQSQKQTEKSEYDRSFKYLEQRVEGFINNMKGLNETFTDRQLKRDQLVKTLNERKNEMTTYENRIAMCVKLLVDKGVEQHEINKYEKKTTTNILITMFFLLVFLVFLLMNHGISQRLIVKQLINY
jgi:hypothetical protein